MKTSLETSIDEKDNGEDYWIISAGNERGISASPFLPLQELSSEAHGMGESPNICSGFTRLEHSDKVTALLRAHQVRTSIWNFSTRLPPQPAPGCCYKVPQTA